MREILPTPRGATDVPPMHDDGSAVTRPRLESLAASAGDLVRVRDATWRVIDIRTFARVRVVRLVGADARNRWQPCTLLEPFDHLHPIAPTRAPRRVSRARWMRTLAALIATSAPAPLRSQCARGHGADSVRQSLARDRTPSECGADASAATETSATARCTFEHATGDWAAEHRAATCPVSVAQAQVTLMPHQIEPVLAVLRGEASRLLLADAVGLGKTIQAALVLRELRARGLADRVLVLVPCGLREQWQQELSHRTGLASVIVDAAALAARTRELPPDVNPWTLPGIHIASLDFMKQPGVLPGADRLAWDVLVVDEAHGLNEGTDRLAAVDVLARRSRHVLLLTATPHHGSDDAFAALCRIGQIGGKDDSIAIFRRTRSAVGLSQRRRIHVWRVKPAREERWLHTLLRRYADRVEREGIRGCRRRGEDEGASADAAALAISVLLKRASSSASSLERSLRRRLALLDFAAEETSDGTPDSRSSAQRSLPFDAGDEAGDEGTGADVDPQHALGAPGLRSRRLERAWLTLLIEAARNAARDESKPRALARWLSRVRGEAALVYTEYRDTLTHLASTLPRDVTYAVLHGGLTADARRLALGRFLSGDARVLLTTDAAGEGLNLHQRCRLVINVELPWNPNRLEQRIGRIDRLGQTRTVHAVHLVAAETAEEHMLARLNGRLHRIEATLGDAPPVLVSPCAPPATPAPSPSTDADAVIRHLHLIRSTHARAWRAWRGRQRGDPLVALETRAPLVAVARRGLPPGVLCIWRTRVLAADGRARLPLLTALHLACDAPAVSVAAVLEAGRERIEAVLDRELAQALRSRDEAERPWRERLARRDAVIAEVLRASADVVVQPSLFAEIEAARASVPIRQQIGMDEPVNDVERMLALVLVVR